MLHIVESRKPPDRVAKDLEEAAARHKFGVLDVHEISTAPPRRLSVYEEGGVTKLATIKPTALIDPYSSPGLKDVAREVEVTLEAIMAEAAR